MNYGEQQKNDNEKWDEKWGVPDDRSLPNWEGLREDGDWSDDDVRVEPEPAHDETVETITFDAEEDSEEAPEADISDLPTEGEEDTGAKFFRGIGSDDEPEEPEESIWG